MDENDVAAAMRWAEQTGEFQPSQIQDFHDLIRMYVPQPKEHYLALVCCLSPCQKTLATSPPTKSLPHLDASWCSTCPCEVKIHLGCVGS